MLWSLVIPSGDEGTNQNQFLADETTLKPISSISLNWTLDCINTSYMKITFQHSWGVDSRQRTFHIPKWELWKLSEHCSERLWRRLRQMDLSHNLKTRAHSSNRRIVFTKKLEESKGFHDTILGQSIRFCQQNNSFHRKKGLQTFFAAKPESPSSAPETLKAFRL